MTKKEENKPKKVNYRVFKTSQRSCFGFWILPQVALLILVIVYVYIRYIEDQKIRDGTPVVEKTTLKRVDIGDVLDNRERAGSPIDLNQTTWGREDPFTGL